ncbi:hypothetical protein SDC9_189480 [bioreactor metagenome]|uniref:Uncharacterized protein n=1 Tax=bioreactor metagenome TaxID=1076179 RepID=A0A645HS98_9ZZZZ
MAACKNETQSVVRNFPIGRQDFFTQLRLLDQCRDLRFFLMKGLFAANSVQRQIAGNPHDPGRRVVGHTIERPNLQRFCERFLDDVFGETKVLDAEDAGQGGHHLSPFLPKEVLEGQGDVPGPSCRSHFAEALAGHLANASTITLNPPYSMREQSNGMAFGSHIF